MTDPSFIPEGERELLVVYPNQRQATAARTALLEAGVPETEIHLDRDVDTVTAMRSEMHAEMTDSWVVPNAGVAYPKEAAQGLMLASIAGAALGLVAAFPLALIDFGSTYWVRWIVWAVLGVAMGLTIALVAGPSSTSPRPAKGPTAAEGIVLRVDRDTADLRRLLASLDPVRIDEVAHDDQPIGTVATPEGDNAIGERVKDAAANAKGDDYHPQR